MMRRLYDWTHVAGRAQGPRKSGLAVLPSSRARSSSSCRRAVPADPGALAPGRAYRYALICTTRFHAGGHCRVHAIGCLLPTTTVAKPVLQFYGKLAEFERLRACAGRGTPCCCWSPRGCTHLPPIKVVTILSGVVDVGITFFIVSCLVARGARFYVLAWALRSYGVPIKAFIEKRLGLIAGVAALVLIGLYFAVGSFAGSGMLTACT